MSNILALLYPLKGSYSGVFLLFWGLMLCACIGLQLLEHHKKQPYTKVENTLFWGFGFAMALFAACRPIGITRDDAAYIEIFNTICPALTCHKLVQGVRDWGWYTLIGLMKSIWDTPRVMLFVSVIGLLIKLWVIFKLCRAPLLALLLFTGLFYQLQDLTAFRVSLSLAVLMLAIWIWINQGRLYGSIAFCLPGFVHKQGFLTVGLILAPLFKRYSIWLLLIVVLMPFAMLWFTGKPQLPSWLINPDDFLRSHAIQQGLDGYLIEQSNGAFKSDKVVPVVFYPLVGLALWLAKDVFMSNRTLYSVVASSIALACWLTWLFAEITPAQSRFFEFFMLPVVLLAGSAKRSALNMVMIAIVSGAWVARHNIIHPLIV